MSPNDIMTATEWGRLMTDASAGLVGGSMGVMGTLAVYENNRFHAKQRSICAYCEGTGSAASTAPLHPGSREHITARRTRLRRGSTATPAKVANHTNVEYVTYYLVSII